MDYMISYKFERNVTIFDYEKIDEMETGIFTTVLSILNEQVIFTVKKVYHF